MFNGPNWWNKRSYLPWYNDQADYNTNAKSYYDYLAKKNWDTELFKDFINRLLKRNIEPKNTDSISIDKEGDWFLNPEAEQGFNDIIQLSADVNVSNETELFNLEYTQEKIFELGNALVVLEDGLFVPDYYNMIKALDNAYGSIPPEIKNIGDTLTNIQQDITNIKQDIEDINTHLSQNDKKIANLTTGLQKIVNNLNDSGAITSNTIQSFSFLSNRDIATGNINLFGGSPDGTSYIKTSNQQTNNDITAGY